MGTKPRDLEIVYKLQWKNTPANGGDKFTVIGMQDIPGTTLKWENFKSYLLKNSGTAGDDVKVSHVFNGKETPIETQEDFQLALYTFRSQARNNEIITLKMDRTSSSKSPTAVGVLMSSREWRRTSNDTESNPPQWFLNYMTQFKKDVVDEITSSFTNVVANLKPHNVSQPSCYHSRKSKVECSKRRKLPPLLGEASNERDILKSLKLEFKLENKLEKLERKTKKIKEKKLALFTKSSDSDAGHSSSRSRSNHNPVAEDDLQMDALPVNLQTDIPKMLGGEIYLHQWEVMNVGKSPWTNKTTLNFTWGSKTLKPIDTVISCPYLKPMEKGVVAVRFQVPNEVGQYESYWSFHHKGRRFGQWLGCQLIVEPFDMPEVIQVTESSTSDYKVPIKKHKVIEDKYQFGTIDQCGIISNGKHTDSLEEKPYHVNENDTTNAIAPESLEETATDVIDEIVRDVSARVDELKINEPTDTNCSSDSDNQSIISLTDSNSSKSYRDEYVVIPNCFKIENTEEANTILSPVNIASEPGINTASTVDKQTIVESHAPNLDKVESPTDDGFDRNNNTEESNQNSSNSSNADAFIKINNQVTTDVNRKLNVILTKEMDDEFAYFMVDENRVPIPKRYLKEEYLTKQLPFMYAPPDLSKNQIEDYDETVKDVDLSHASAIGSCFSDINPIEPTSSRLFIFPQNCPGYEIVTTEEEVPFSTFTKTALGNTGYAYNGSNTAPTRYDAYGPLDEPAVVAQPVVNPQNIPFGLTHGYVQDSTNPIVEEQFYQACSNISQSDPKPEEVIALDNISRFLRYEGQQPDVQNSTDFFNHTEKKVDYDKISRFLRDEKKLSPLKSNTESPIKADFEGKGENPAVPEAPPQEVNLNQSQTKESQVKYPTSQNTDSPPNTQPQNVHILPDTLVAGAVNVASSAINTARSVINMIKPREPGRWVDGHWVSSNLETPRETNLRMLAEMGFWDRDLNATLLARYNDDVNRVISELVQ